MKSAPWLVAMALLFVCVRAVAEPALSADKIMTKAEAQAASEHKNIFLTFDASW